MLKSLSITNYAIIGKLEIEFSNGLNIITGETGAGKSILLGALSLLLGQRADSGILKNKEVKCVVEGCFEIGKYSLNGFFKENDIDYDDHTIIRREIAANGKSRAFVNDMPVNLNALKDLSAYLIDIHSQHENLHLQDNDFQLMVIDTLADNKSLINDFSNELANFNSLKRLLQGLKEETTKLQTDKEYYEFQFNELDKAALKSDELVDLESEYKSLSHAGEIKENLSEAIQTLALNEVNVLSGMKDVLNNLNRLKEVLDKTGSLFERLESLYIDLKDIEQEIDALNNKTNLDPERLEFVNERLNLIYSLLQKHKVKTIEELISIREDFKKKLENIYFSDEKILALENKINESRQKLEKHSAHITQSRKQVLPSIEEEVNKTIVQLGMEHSSFKIFMEKSDDFVQNGSDLVRFMFSSGKGMDYQELSRIASGGEISRLMLSIKSLITRFVDLPTIIFDEIDTGVSGEIADKMGNIIKSISKDMQVINITHLPQIASKGDFHYLVHKINGEGTETKMKLLSNEERVVEVAKMLSGAELTEAALQNARELLNG